MEHGRNIEEATFEAENKASLDTEAASASILNPRTTSNKPLLLRNDPMENSLLQQQEETELRGDQF